MAEKRSLLVDIYVPLHINTKGVSRFRHPLYGHSELKPTTKDDWGQVGSLFFYCVSTSNFTAPSEPKVHNLKNMADLEQAQFDIAKAIYIERIVNTDKKGKSLSEKEIAQEAISSAEIFMQEWDKVKSASNKTFPSSAFIANKGM